MLRTVAGTQLTQSTHVRLSQYSTLKLSRCFKLHSVTENVSELVWSFDQRVSCKLPESVFTTKVDGEVCFTISPATHFSSPTPCASIMTSSPTFPWLETIRARWCFYTVSNTLGFKTWKQVRRSRLYIKFAELLPVEQSGIHPFCVVRLLVQARHLPKLLCTGKSPCVWLL